MLILFFATECRKPLLDLSLTHRQQCPTPMMIDLATDALRPFCDWRNQMQVSDPLIQ